MVYNKFPYLSSVSVSLDQPAITNQSVSKAVVWNVHTCPGPARTFNIKSCLDQKSHFDWQIRSNLLSQRQILGTGNLPQDSALVCIDIDISPEMAAQSSQ